MSAYAVPDHPADPEAADYQLIAELPGVIPGHEDTLWMTHRCADTLRQPHAPAGMAWHDARPRRRHRL